MHQYQSRMSTQNFHCYVWNPDGSRDVVFLGLARCFLQHFQLLTHLHHLHLSCLTRDWGTILLSPGYLLNLEMWKRISAERLLSYRSKNGWEYHPSKISFYYNSFGNSFRVCVSCIMHHTSRGSFEPIGPTHLSHWNRTVFTRVPTNIIFQVISMETICASLSLKPITLLWGIDVSRCFTGFLMLCAVSSNEETHSAIIHDA